MSEDLLKTVRDLIAAGKGDIKRLRGIMSTIKQGNPVYLSDYRYIQSLTSEESAHQQVEDKGDNLMKEKPKQVKKDESLNLLRIRLAEGQITVDEFRELKKALTED
jgi:hypothetical protein